MAMELRARVEAVFRKRFSDRGSRLHRRGFVEMLELLGLKTLEADSFVDAFDPMRRPHLNYDEFLDFIFSPTEAAAADGAAGERNAAESATNGEVNPPGCCDDLEPRIKIDVNSFASFGGDVPLDEAVAADAEAGAAEASSREPPPPPEEAPPPAPPEKLESKGDNDSVAQAKDVSKETKSEAVAGIAGAGLLCTEEECADAGKTEELVDPKAATKTTEAGSSEGTLPCEVDTPLNGAGETQKLRNDPEYLDASSGQWYADDVPQSSSIWDPMISPHRLGGVASARLWTEQELREGWCAAPMHAWPPYPAQIVPVASAAPMMHGGSAGNGPFPPATGSCEGWSTVRVRVIPDLVGGHARESTRRDRPYVNEILAGRYQVESCVGAGQFTRALLATDLTTGKRVCVKRHNGITVELLTDLLAIGKRLEAVDPDGACFPRLFDWFFDMSGYTVESMIEGRNCLDVARCDPTHFANVENLRHVAAGALHGLSLLSAAGIVHCDVKPDNIMWTEPSVPGGKPRVRLVDFGCARLDRRLEGGRNWSLAEGGAGHLGKWALEMVLRLPITDRSDVWGLAIATLELHCGRFLWCCEEDSVEIVLAQILGLVGLRDGLPASLLRRSPLDITRLYTPAPEHFPVRRIGGHDDMLLEELRPTSWGLSSVLGTKPLTDARWAAFADYVKQSLTVDHEERPSAAELLNHTFVQGHADASPAATTSPAAAGGEQRGAANAKVQAAGSGEELPNASELL
eukprot:TRINITY_DN14244_c0_g2_i1.p1 TRINITY_DN14244_c0_g2~~TRINITY_DN14244_c0_g2_i1.p1  ORF type:complete len:745 (+),score=176.76 TRINITY_DN14244_c0_g2_i1:191-2425(+)